MLKLSTFSPVQCTRFDVTNWYVKSHYMNLIAAGTLHCSDYSIRVQKIGVQYQLSYQLLSTVGWSVCGRNNAHVRTQNEAWRLRARCTCSQSFGWYLKNIVC
jgi:hypothetical protein